MYKFILFILMSLSAVLTSASEDAGSILRAADGYRTLGQPSKIVMDIDLYKSGELDSQKTFDVYTKPNKRSLVVYTSNKEVGQKVLMLDDKYWLFMPRSRRPIRITPLQKLLGEASTGDVASLSWSDEYRGGIANASAEVDGQSAILLELLSKRKGTTYERIELWVGQQNYRPLKANLYLKSGKLAKQASYEIGRLRDRDMVTKMTLTDKISLQQKTVIRYLDVQPKSIPNKLYNPAYLVKNKLSSL